MWDEDVFNRLEAIVSASRMGGGTSRIQKQHAQGKLTARERIEILFDADTFTEVSNLVESRFDSCRSVPGDGVVTGYGKINGKLVFASSEDYTVIGGTLGEAHSAKICKIMDMALDMRAPIITINDSGGARIEEGVCSLAGYSGIFLRNTRASGVIPQISVIMGPCAGGACYSPAISDFIFMVRNTSYMFITGPQVVKAVLNEEVSLEQLGGADMHTKESGVGHFIYEDDKSCLLGVRDLLSYLPQCNASPLPVKPGTPVDLCKGLQEVVVQNQRRCYDVRAVIGAMADKSSFLEVQKDFATNAVIGFGRIDGETIGFIANQPNFMSGSLDIHASDKIARFIRFCDCFNIPLVTLVDVPAFLPGSQQERGGIIRHGAKILYAFSEATVPKISLILRKAYGGAYIAMNSKNMGADIVFAWPIAQIAVMGAEGAVNILYKKQIDASQDPANEQKRLIKEYEEHFMNPYLAASYGYVDEVIRPEETRMKIKNALDMLKNKKQVPVAKKHGNMPL